MPTDTTAVPGRGPSREPVDAQLLAAAAAALAEQRACSHDAAFDALLDVARRSHVSVRTAAVRVLSRPSADPGSCEQQHPHACADLPRGDVGGVDG
ncbi:ANTAR domain-containing protein [Rhodococcus sp. WS4]|nr:ANTAR domain-containing protein [Rhodococcus sp. WS4]